MYVHYANDTLWSSENTHPSHIWWQSVNPLEDLLGSPMQLHMYYSWFRNRTSFKQTTNSDWFTVLRTSPQKGTFELIFFPRGGYCYSCSVFFCRCKMSQYSNQYTYTILILASTFQNDPKASWEFTSWNSVCNPTKALDLHLLGFEGLTSSTLPTAFVFSIKLFQEMDIQHGNAKKNAPFLEANVNISPFTDRGPMLGTPPRVWNTGVLRGIPGGDHQ